MSADIKSVNLTIAVPPRKLGNERRAIEDKLNTLISQYVHEADGVLVKWSDLDVLNDKGIIIDDQPYGFWKIRFTAHVFKPIEGKLVKGKVNRVFKNYFIVKAMDSFVATVSLPDNLAENDTLRHLMVDQEVYFKVVGCAEGDYRGELDDECIELTTECAKQQSELTFGESAYEYAKDFQY